MMRVAGVDGTPGGWAVVTMNADGWNLLKVPALAKLLDAAACFDVVAIDVPIGLLDMYETGGRACDRAARKLLGKPRASSVFPPPIRCVLDAASWDEACMRSQRSGNSGKRVPKQTFAILPKIKEVDDLLQSRPELRKMVREVHPEVCFHELAGRPMTHNKKRTLGREERRQALTSFFPRLDLIEAAGRAMDLPIEDILDAAVACWSAHRLAAGHGRSLPAPPIPLDTQGLEMAIWV